MEHESFEDDDDRRAHERALRQHQGRSRGAARPRRDLHEAVQAMTGQGGWPMTVFLTPDGAPFYGGTYFPPDDRHGMPSLPAACCRPSRTPTATGAASASSSAAAVARGLYAAPSAAAARRERARRRHARRGADAASPASSTRATAASAARRSFRQPMALEFLLRALAAHGRPERAARCVAHTLDADGPRRHLRPARRRLPSLLGRRALARAALREDALRQRAARALYLHRWQATGSR